MTESRSQQAACTDSAFMVSSLSVQLSKLLKKDHNEMVLNIQEMFRSMWTWSRLIISRFVIDNVSFPNFRKVSGV